MATKKTLNVSGMHCAACALNISKTLQKEEGVKSAEVNYATEKASLEFDETKIDQSRINQIIDELGYHVVASSQEQENDGIQYEKSQKLKVVLAIILSLPIVIRMFWMWELDFQIFWFSATDWIQLVLTFIIVFFLGRDFHKNAFVQLKSFQSNMDTLISLGTLTAFFYSLWALTAGKHLYFESAAAITALILLGKYFELKTKGRASQAMKKLMELGAKKARIIVDGQEIEKDINDIKVGDILLIKPSEKIALDGVIIEGDSSLDESMLTGESLPVNKTINDKVFGATLNLNGVIKIKVTQVGEGTVLAQIIKTVEDAQRFKAPIQKLADKIASIFVPSVIIISIVTFLGWLITTGSLELSIINAVAVLIIACPCALGIATPVAVMVGTSVGAKQGILIKSGEAFEKAKKIDTVIFDKTGTLTKGEPIVAEIIQNAENEFPIYKILKVAGSLAKNSEHPLSKAISKRVAEEKDLILAEFTNFKEISGQGLSATCSAHKTELLMGNLKLLEAHKIDTKWPKILIGKYAKAGGTLNFVTHGEKVVGAILITDEIKESAKEAVAKIKSLNIEPMMISGDNIATANSVAAKIGIEKVIAEVLPQEKQNEVKKLQSEGKRVLFVGDGINDAPSLVQADLGIAMGSGTDIAKESGQIIIMKNDPLKVFTAINLSQKTFKVIKQNLFWAFAYNVAAIPLAMAGLINPMLAAAAMSFSSISVITNSLRIYRK